MILLLLVADEGCGIAAGTLLLLQYTLSCDTAFPQHEVFKVLYYFVAATDIDHDNSLLLPNLSTNVDSHRLSSRIRVRIHFCQWYDIVNKA